MPVEYNVSDETMARANAALEEVRNVLEELRSEAISQTMFVTPWPISSAKNHVNYIQDCLDIIGV